MSLSITVDGEKPGGSLAQHDTEHSCSGQMDTAGHHQRDLGVCGESQQGHQRHTEPKGGIKILLLLGGWPERESKNLIQN